MFQFTFFCILFLASTVLAQAPVDPSDTNLDTLQLLEKYNYPYEVHNVTTDDGYIIVLYRILNKQPGVSNPKVVFLNHGFISNTWDWVGRGPGQALGYLLADAGYDVWMINNRGNGVSMTATGPAANDFWNYSLDDTGKYDTTAAIDFVLAKTNQPDLTFIAHSQGCTMYYIMCLEKPEYEAKVNKFIALAPLFNMRFAKSYYQLGPLLRPYSLINPFNFNVEPFLDNVVEGVCSLGAWLCKEGYMMVHGYASSEVPDAFLRIIRAHYPSGSSYKNFLHVSQFIGQNSISKYDYGLIKNQQLYGSDSAPLYDLTKAVITKKYVFYGQRDIVINPQTLEFVKSQLKNLQLFQSLPYAHNDFVLGWSVKTNVNDKILAILNE